MNHLLRFEISTATAVGNGITATTPDRCLLLEGFTQLLLQLGSLGLSGSGFGFGRCFGASIFARFLCPKKKKTHQTQQKSEKCWKGNIFEQKKAEGHTGFVVDVLSVVCLQCEKKHTVQH